MSISIETLKEAVEIKEQIAALEARLAKVLAGQEINNGLLVQGGEVGNRKKGRRTMSAAARAKIAAAQKARWAKQKGTSSAPIPKPAKKKRHLSPEGRAAIVAALKKRWAKK